MPNILLTMINASLKAGKAILDVKADSKYSVRAKADNSPVTDADLAAQHLITENLAPLGIPMISEESAADDYSVRRKWREVFIIDPLDGTKEFIDGTHQYGVNIALVQDGCPVAGVIYLPEDRMLYFGSREQPALRARCEPTDRFASLSDIPALALPLENENQGENRRENYILLVSKSRHTSEMTHYLDEFRQRKPQAEIVPMASCVKYCTIAEGRADQYTRYGSVMEWDTAAGDALLRSLGMELRSIYTGSPLMYNKENLKSSDFTITRNTSKR